MHVDEVARVLRDSSSVLRSYRSISKGKWSRIIHEEPDIGGPVEIQVFFTSFFL